MRHDIYYDHDTFDTVFYQRFFNLFFDELFNMYSFYRWHATGTNNQLLASLTLRKYLSICFVFLMIVLKFNMRDFHGVLEIKKKKMTKEKKQDFSFYEVGFFSC